MSRYFGDFTAFGKERACLHLYGDGTRNADCRAGVVAWEENPSFNKSLTARSSPSAVPCPVCAVATLYLASPLARGLVAQSLSTGEYYHRLQEYVT